MIGTSDGTHYPDEFSYALDQLGSHLAEQVGFDPQGDSQYQDWVSRNSEITGRDMSQDDEDYDLRAYYEKNPGDLVKDQHLPDTYKKPNHPTFSEESIYHGSINGSDLSPSKTVNEGGRWEKNDDKTWNFFPGSTNLKHHSPQDLREYFDKYEKGNHLILPGSDSGEYKVAGDVVKGRWDPEDTEARISLNKKGLIIPEYVLNPATGHMEKLNAKTFTLPIKPK